MVSDITVIKQVIHNKNHSIHYLNMTGKVSFPNVFLTVLNSLRILILHTKILLMCPVNREKTALNRLINTFADEAN
jgi:hypothetical protein